MALTKYLVHGSTMAQRAEEILEFLQTNATEYFDTISADEDGNITCYVGDIPALFLPYQSGKKLKVTISNDDSFEDYYAGEVVFSVIYYSSHGIMMKSANWTIAISKNNNNHTVIVFPSQSGASSTTIGYRFADIVDGIEITTTFGEASDYKETISKTTPMTAIIPIVFDSGYYCDGLLLTIYSEYPAISGILTIGDTQYGYDGAVALRG